MRTIVSVAGNTFAESIRQPVYGVILALAGGLIVISPSFAMYTFMESTKLVQDMGLATIMLAGLFLAAFGAASVITREIENRTVLTVLSKPVSREAFLLGKYLGVAGAVTLACYILTALLMFTFRFGVKDTASTQLDWGVALATATAGAAAVIIGFCANYFFGRPFVSVAAKAVALCLSVEMAVFAFLGAEYAPVADGSGLNWQIAIAALLALMSVLVIAAVAVTASTRLKAVGTLVVCTTVFLLGLVSQYYLGRHAGTSTAAWIASVVVPNMQLFWVAESMVKGQQIPLSLVAWVGMYTACYLGAALSLGMVLFGRREAE